MAPKTQSKPIVLEPTMGVSAESYRMLCNVVSRKGTLERRPRIVATETNFSIATVGSDNKAFGPQWRVTAVTDSVTVTLECPGGLVLGSSGPAYITGSHGIKKVGTNDDILVIHSLTTYVGQSYVSVSTTTNHGLSVGGYVYVVNGGYASLAEAIDFAGVSIGDAFNMTVPYPLGEYGPVTHEFHFVDTAVASVGAGNFGIALDTANTPAKAALAVKAAINGISHAAVGYGGGINGSVLASGTLGLTAALSVTDTKLTLTMDVPGPAGNVANVLAALVCFEGSKLITTTFTGGSYGEHVHSRIFLATSRTLEGIDCEIIQGKIVSIYLGTESAGDTNLYFYHSYHHPGDPRMGYLRDASVYGTKKDDYPSNWYKQAAYWKRRIVPSFTDYMITGHNVGPAFVGGSTTAAINEADSVSLFTGFPLKMLGTNAVRTTIPRLDPFASFYSLYSPKNAFAHVDRHSGQAIWYGFLDGENYSLNGTLPADDVILMEAQGDVSDARDTLIVRPYHIWYSEPGSPLSLSVVGWIPLTVGSHDKNIVGMADFQNGTAIFSHDTVHFMRGIGADTGSNAISRVILGDGIGADSPWSIKSVGDGVAFANTKGLYYLNQSGQVREISGFSELFGEEGVDCSRGPYHEYFGTVGNAPSDNAGDVSGSIADRSYSTFDSHPWRTFKVDKARLDRAVAGVWDDLYLLFVSLDGDPYGEDNRLCLCWNWKESGAKTPRHAWREGPTSVWLLPKNMGVRGWAYDGSLATPYVMTRYGLAKFEKSPSADVVWQNAGPTESDGSTARVPERHPAHEINSTDGLGHISSVNTSASNTPIIIGQSHWMPETGDSFVTTNVIVQHETKNDTLQSAETWSYVSGSDSSGTVPYTGGDTDGKMRIRIWAMQGEIMQSSGNFSSFPFGKMRFTKADIDPLENLVARSGFKLWRGRHAMHNATTWGSTDNDGTVRLPRGIRRASSARGGFSSSRCAFQFSTSNPDKIFSVQVIMSPVAPRGEGA